MFLDGNGSSFLFDNVDRPMLGNPRHSWILDFTPLIPDSRYWIPVSVSGTWILDSKCDLVRFRILELYSGFRIPGLRIPQTKISRIPETRFSAYIRWGWGRPWIAHCMKLETECKMPRRRRQRERQKSNWLNKQNNNSARASRFLVHFFTVTATTRGKWLNSRFMEEVNKWPLIFLSLSELKYDSWEFGSKRVCLHFTK